MGNCAPSRIFGKNEQPIGDNIIIIGPYFAGKNTLQEKLISNPNTSLKFGIGLNSAGHIGILSSDIGGRCTSHSLIRHFSKMMDVVIYMVDSTTVGEDFIRDDFQRVAIDEELLEKPVLVLANKQDLPEALSIQEIDEKLEVTKLKEQTKKQVLEILPASVLTGEGVEDVVEWIQRQLLLKRAHEALVKPVQKAVPPCIASFYTSVSSGLKQTFGSMKQAMRR